MKAAHTYDAELVRVIDADTIVLDIDAGFHMWARGIKVRVAHINAPEMNTPEGRAAYAFAMEWFASRKRLVVVTIQDKSGNTKADSFGRYLADVYGEGEGMSLSEKLIEAGHAKEYK